MSTPEQPNPWATPQSPAPQPLAPPLGAPPLGETQQAPPATAEYLAPPVATGAVPNTAAPPVGPAPTRPRKSLGAGAIVAIVLVPILLIGALCVAGTVGFFVLQSGQGSESAAGPAPSASPSGPAMQRALGVGDCLNGTSRQYVLQSCMSASHKVIAAPQDGAQCPEQTDAIGSDVDDQVLCLISLSAVHPGAPGAGGGILRVGDCLPNVDVEGQVEIACVAGKAFHRITAVVADRKNCKKPAVRSLLADQRSAKGELVHWCLVDAAGIASPGECVAWTKKEAPSDIPVSCSTRPVLKFTGRASTTDGCLRWSNPTWYAPRFENLPHVMYNCYRKLGPAN